MTSQRRRPVSGADNDHPTESFEAVSGDAERRDSPVAGQPDDDRDRPTQVIDAVRDDPPDFETAVIPRLRDEDPDPRTEKIPVHPERPDREPAQQGREPAQQGREPLAPANAAPDATAPARTAPASEPGQRRPVLLVALLLAVALAGAGASWYFDRLIDEASRARPAGNLALIDTVATTAVIEQVSRAVEAIYSYDAAMLDQSESRALALVTGSYVEEFKRNFASVRQLGPQQRASLASKVVAAGVVSLSERRATLLMMVDQEGRRGDTAAPLKAALRLTVTAQRVDGQWKVSGVNQR